MILLFYKVFNAKFIPLIRVSPQISRHGDLTEGFLRESAQCIVQTGKKFSREETSQWMVIIAFHAGPITSGSLVGRSKVRQIPVTLSFPR
jgi:hypothetical protein